MVVPFFWGGGGLKIGKHLELCGQTHYRTTRKSIDSRTPLHEPAECASGGDPLLRYKNLNLPFFPTVRIPYALRLESQKNLLTRL